MPIARNLNKVDLGINRCDSLPDYRNIGYTLRDAHSATVLVAASVFVGQRVGRPWWGLEIKSLGYIHVIVSEH